MINSFYRPINNDFALYLKGGIHSNRFGSLNPKIFGSNLYRGVPPDEEENLEIDVFDCACCIVLRVDCGLFL